MEFGVARKFAGNPPASDRDWVQVEGFHDDWELWLWWNLDYDMRCCKLFARQPVEAKANYWFSFDGVKLVGNKDKDLLQAGRPELYDRVMEVLSE